MRISDWSSDVCSSDLEIVETVDAASFFAAPRHPYARQLLAAIPTFAKRGKPLSEPDASTASNAFSNPLAAPALNTGTQALLDRKSGVSGKSGSVRLDPGGRRIITKKKSKQNNK